jgi:hypothetical protein
MKQTKQCGNCGVTYTRHPKHSCQQWATSACCSSACANKLRATHGQRHTRLYRVWAGIKTRCLNQSDPLYQHYGARGITIAAEWADSFVAFAEYIGSDPGPEMQVGRIDNDKGYEPGNVRWESRTENMRNMRNSVFVTIDGERMHLRDACDKFGGGYKKAWRRIVKDGWDHKRAVIS